MHDVGSHLTETRWLLSRAAEGALTDRDREQARAMAEAWRRFQEEPCACPPPHREPLGTGLAIVLGSCPRCGRLVDRLSARRDPMGSATGRVVERPPPQT